MRAWIFLFFLPLVCGCGSDDERPEIWIYTSIYPSVYQRMAPAIEAQVPEARIRWFKQGSEQVAARVNMELESGGTRCDLLVTSDPFYYAELAAEGLLLPYDSPAARVVPDALRDPENAWVTVRIPVMVLGVNPAALEGATPPLRFDELAAPRYRDLVSMGDPLKSGTNFTTVAALSRSAGWALFEGWSRNGLVAAGGNSAVIRRLEIGERPIGVVLLENLLPRIEKGAPIEVVYPMDGAVPVPSPVAIFASTRHPDLARKTYDALFSPAVQAAIVEGHMYSPLPGTSPPVGAPPWAELALQAWSAAFVDEVSGQRQQIKERFREIMRR